MPFVLRGVMNEVLEEINSDAEDLEEPVEDPMYNMVEIWTKYDMWYVAITRPCVSMTEVNLLRARARKLFSLIDQVFPFKHGPEGKENAWRIMKRHDMTDHIMDNIPLAGCIQV
jgi:hypothetical protein